MSEEKQETNGFFAGVIFGAILGGAMAMFLGGEEGKEVRKVLRQKSKTFFTNLNSLVGETADEGADLIEEGKVEVGKVVEETKEEVEKAMVAIKDESKKSVRRFFLRAGRKLS